jgi:hypothetical protein
VASADHIEAGLTDLLRQWDEHWNNLDFDWLSGLWERDNPRPIYIGEEYPGPLIGPDEIDRHWAGTASRIKAATVSSTLDSFDVPADGIVRLVMLNRWRVTNLESDFENEGASWVTWLLVRRDDQYRIFHQMEAPVYLSG